MTTTKNPEPTWTKNPPQLELQLPLGSFKALVLTPDFLCEGSIIKLKVRAVSDPRDEVNCLLRLEVFDPTGVFLLTQEVPAKSFACAVK